MTAPARASSGSRSSGAGRVWKRAAAQHARPAQAQRAVAAHVARGGPEVDPAPARRVQAPPARARLEHGRREQVGAEAELVVGASRPRVARVGEQAVAHERHAGGAVARVGGLDVRQQLRVQLGVAAPDRQRGAVEDLGALVGRDGDPRALGAHHARDGAQLDPALEQLGRQTLLRAEGVVAADVGAPARHAAHADVERLGDGRAQAVEAPDGRRVSAPHVDRAARRPRPAGALEAHQRTPEAAHDVAHRAVVVAREAVVDARRRGPVGGHHVGRGPLAEVLHPAVLALGDRLAQQARVELPRGGRGEVELGERLDAEPAGPLAADEPGEGERPAVGAALERSGRRGLAEHGLVGLAQVRAEVGELRQPRGVQAARALELVLAVEAVLAARQEAHLGLGGRHRRVRVAQRAEDARLLRERDHVRLAGLHPGAVRPGRWRGGLAAGRPGEAPQRVGRARAREDAQVEPARVYLDAPAPSAHEEAAGLVVVDQHAVAAAREQPGDRVVGGVAAVDLGPVRRRHAGDRLVGLEERAVGGVVEDLAAALVDRVGALAEAGQALAPARREADRDRPGAGRAGQVHRGHAGPGPRDAHADAVVDPAGEGPRVDGLRRRRRRRHHRQRERRQQQGPDEPHRATR